MLVYLVNIIPLLLSSFKKWTVGSPCRAVYSEDGAVYEAVIIKVFENTGTCLVKFIGKNISIFNLVGYKYVNM